jgi:hypothetical protein
MNNGWAVVFNTRRIIVFPIARFLTARIRLNWRAFTPQPGLFQPGARGLPAVNTKFKGKKSDFIKGNLVIRGSTPAACAVAFEQVAMCAAKNSGALLALAIWAFEKRFPISVGRPAPMLFHKPLERQLATRLFKFVNK